MTTEERTTPTQSEARTFLTPRDLQVIDMTAQGIERNDIAQTLGLSRSAVNRHMAKALKLTGARNGAHLVYLLTRSGLAFSQGAVTAASQRDQAVRTVRECLMAAPGGDVDIHVNGVIETIAQRLENEL